MNNNESSRDNAWTYLKCAIAAILFLAAGAKVVNIVPILSGDGLLSSQPILLAVIVFEAAAGTYLLIGNDYLSWTLALMTFGLFALFSVYALATGQSCNCISKNVGPQWMLPIDLAVLALALLLRPGSASRNARISSKRITFCLLVSGVVVGVAIGRHHTTDQTDPLRYLFADQMVGKPWPVGSAFHAALQSLESGKWMAIVVRRDCDHCRELLSEHFSDPSQHRTGERTVVFVAGNTDWPFQFDYISMEPSGENAIVWEFGEPFVASPAVFLLADGIVVKASDGAKSDKLMHNLKQEI